MTEAAVDRRAIPRAADHLAVLAELGRRQERVDRGHPRDHARGSEDRPSRADPELPVRVAVPVPHVAAAAAELAPPRFQANAGSGGRLAGEDALD
eukprot:15439465-Alexandrium_andersonii.AAC.1